MTDQETGLSIARQRIAREVEARSGFLDLGKLGLTALPEELFALQHLRCLLLGWGMVDEQGEWRRSSSDIAANALPSRELARLAELSGLRALSLSGMDLHDLTPLAGLSALQMLYCGSTPVSDLTPLAGLSALQTLDCRHTQVSDLTPLAGLGALQTLGCSDTPVSDLTPLAGLGALQTLDCRHTQVSDLMPLAGLSALQELRCGYTSVSNLTPLAGLGALQTLYCDSTPVSDLTPLAGLGALQTLGCGGTPVSDLTPLAGLSALQTLHCDGTPVSDLTPLAGLGALRSLFCSNCRLNCIPDGLCYKPSLHELYLYRTPLPGIPSEVLSQDYGDNCLHRLRAHLDDLAAGAAALLDVKLLVLGNGRVGKTQLCRRLRGEDYDPALPSTHGIVVSSAPLSGQAEAQLKLWDFGGQDIYHGTHALFMRSRAVFVLVWAPECEAMGEHEYGGMLFRNFPLAYWLDYVRHLAGTDSPLLIVQTRCERAEDEVRFPPLPQQAVQDFPFCKILHYSALRDKGRAALDEALAEAAAWLQQQRGTAQIGAGRLRVQRRLEALRDADALAPQQQRQYRTLSQAHYLQLCQEADGVSAPQHLLDYLHQAGVVFYRRGLFDEQIILDQAWALEAVYAVFHREKCYRQLRQLRGRFSRALLELLVWQEYSADEQQLFLDMMESCGVCFVHQRGQERDGSDSEYIAPDLLPDKSAIAAELQEKWDADAPHSAVRLRYPMLHGGLLRGLLARIGAEAGINALYWQGGLCLYEHTSRSRALIEQHLEDGWCGWIGLQTQGGQAETLLAHLLEWLRREEQRWGLCGIADEESAVRSEAASRPLQETQALLLVQAPVSQPEYCVSYAWGDCTSAGLEREAEVDRLCREAEARGVRIVRDKQALGLGDSISRFMARIGRADRVFVFLSDKYLKSPYCMFELWEIWRYSRQEPAAFLQRVRLYRLPCAAISSPLERARHAVYWKKQHDELAALIREHGADVLGEADFKQFKLMQDFSHRVGDMLAALTDPVQPRDFEEFLSYGLDDVPPVGANAAET